MGRRSFFLHWDISTMAKGRYDPNWRPTPPPFFKICNALLAGKTLSAVEAKFVEETRHAWHRSEKQQKWLDRIIARSMRDKPPARRRHRGFADELDDEIRF
jgi:hypothetical protein